MEESVFCLLKFVNLSQPEGEQYGPGVLLALVLPAFRIHGDISKKSLLS